MLRYKLRTLLILLAVLPPLLAVSWWKYSAWRVEQERQRAQRELVQQLKFGSLGTATTGVPAPPQPMLPTVGPPGVPTETRRPPDSGPMPVSVPKGPGE